MASNRFFDEMLEQSAVKAAIVSKYFDAWAKVMVSTLERREQHPGRGQQPIGYVDLFAGPGRYEDGRKSTPLLVLEKAIADPKLSARLIAIFNDKNTGYCTRLRREIASLPGINCLTHQPVLLSEAAGIEVLRLVAERGVGPTFFFVDPWGYKGISLGLVNSMIKEWGCECMMLFNYRRVSMALPNTGVEQHMDALFGQPRADQLRDKLARLESADKELAIIEEMCQALMEAGGKYTLPFSFRDRNADRTSHHLIFVSKHPLGYEIMKKIMAGESSIREQGVASFQYNPASELQPFLFELSRPLEDLERMLLSDFAGVTLTVREVYEHHNVGKPYIDKNYKDALRKLEAAGKVAADPAASARHTGTMGDNVRITFPRKRC